MENVINLIRKGKIILKSQTIVHVSYTSVLATVKSGLRATDESGPLHRRRFPWRFEHLHRSRSAASSHKLTLVAAGRKPLHLQSGAGELAASFYNIVARAGRGFRCWFIKTLTWIRKTESTVLDNVNIDIYHIH